MAGGHQLLCTTFGTENTKTLNPERARFVKCSCFECLLALSAFCIAKIDTFNTTLSERFVHDSFLQFTVRHFILKLLFEFVRYRILGFNDKSSSNQLLGKYWFRKDNSLVRHYFRVTREFDDFLLSSVETVI